MARIFWVVCPECNKRFYAATQSSGTPTVNYYAHFVVNGLPTKRQ
jgi:hypothetical protein